MAAKKQKSNPKKTQPQNKKKTVILLSVLGCVCVLAAALLLFLPGKDKGSVDPALTYYADIEIADYGTVTVKLDQNAAPITVANFVKLAQSGFYDGLTFHRIIESFMMQGGAPDNTSGKPESIVGEFRANGYDNNLSHTRGAISMARANDFNSGSSQFFIVHQDSLHLDGQYAAFGYVTKGMEVVDAVCTAAQPTDGNGSIAPADRPVITKITVRTETAAG